MSQPDRSDIREPEKVQLNLTSILVAIDSTSAARPLVKSAIHLAFRTKANLRAIYIEESEWFEASRFSFTQQVSSYTGELLPFTEKDLSDESKAVGALHKRLLSGYSKQLQVRWNYEIKRGPVDRELLKAASISDLVHIGRVRISGRRTARIGRNARYLAGQCNVPLCIWNEPTPEWPTQLIGLCTTPKESVQVVNWTLGLAATLGRTPRLFWSEELMEKSERDRFAEEVHKWFPEIEDQVFVNSEMYGSIDTDLLSHYPGPLLIARRKMLGAGVDEAEMKRKKPLFERLANSLILLS